MGRAASRAVRAFLAAALLAGAAAPGVAGGVESFPEELITTSRGLGGSGATLPPLPNRGDPALRVMLFDPTNALSPRTAAAMGEELRTIFRDLSVDLGFTLAGGGATLGESGRPEIPVIVLPTDPVARRRSRKVLGLVMRDQKPMRAIWSFLDSLHWTLGGDARMPGGGAEADVALGVALGRVVAHEIVHAVAPQEPHATGGLMRHSLNRTFLLGESVRLDERCRRVFLAGLAARTAEIGQPSAVPPPGVVADAEAGVTAAR